MISNTLDFTGLHWTSLDWDWTPKSGLQSSVGPVDWTGLDWTLHQPIWPGKRATGIQWSPLESTGVHMDYMGEGKDLCHCAHGEVELQTS